MLLTSHPPIVVLHKLVVIRELRQVVDLVHHEDIGTVDVGAALVESPAGPER